MKLLVLGATGGTGQAVISQALERGHEVIALVRSPDKLTSQHDKLKVVKGDVLSTEQLAEHMSGCDAVVSSLGGRPGLFAECNIYSEPIKAVSNAMKQTGVERLICVSAWGTKDVPGLPFVWRWLMKPTIMKAVVQDMDTMEEYLASDECQHINYTVVRPPRLINVPSTGGPVQAMEGQLVTGADNQICRQDLATFMLDCLVTRDWDRKMVAVTRPKADIQPQSEKSEG